MRKGAEKKPEWKQFAGLLAIGLLLGVTGYAMGYASTVFESDATDLVTGISNRMQENVYPLVLLAILGNCVLTAALLFYWRKAKELARKTTFDDEEAMDALERIISKASYLLNVGQSVCLILFAVAIHFGNQALSDRKVSFVPYIVLLALWLLIIVAMILVYSAIHRIEKEYNPAKKSVNIYSVFALKQYENAGDEGEKKIIYMAGYKGFTAMLYATWILVCVSMVADTFRPSLSTVLFVLIVNLAGMIAFSYTAWKLEHGGGQK